MANWGDLLREAANGEIINECTLSDSELNREFDDGTGCIEGASFFAWGDLNVFFPVARDNGAEYISKAPRHPSDGLGKFRHIGDEDLS